MEIAKRGKRALRLRPLPPSGIPRWLKERLANLTTVGGVPDLNVVASSLLYDRQALRWALSRFKLADRLRLALLSRFVLKWQLYAATYYARRLAGVPLSDSKPQARAKRLKGEALSPTLSARLTGKPLSGRRRVKCSPNTLMARISKLFFKGQPAPGWCFDLLKADMRCVRNWRYRNPVMFNLLVTGKLPKGLLGKAGHLTDCNSTSYSGLRLVLTR